MYHDIANLTRFYASPMGQRVRADIATALTPYYPKRGECVVGLGFPIPYLEVFSSKSERCFAFMPARQGACVWPNPTQVATALVFEEDLPLPDSCIDRLLLIHALEQVENAAQTLRELWRVLAPDGQLIIVVPNRHGLWAWADYAAFGSGTPYSRGQLQNLLQQADFSLLSMHEALHFLPRKDWQVKRASALYGRFSRHLIPRFGGVLLAHAQKRRRQGSVVIMPVSKRVFMPLLPTPQNA